MLIYVWLVVTGTWMDYDFPYTGIVMTPTDELDFRIFFRGVGQPPTRCVIVGPSDFHIVQGEGTQAPTSA
jgi:hypothetical protein